MTEWQRKALALYEAGYTKAAIGRQLQGEMGAATAENASTAAEIMRMSLRIISLF
jgi:hypothetical protein